MFNFTEFLPTDRQTGPGIREVLVGIINYLVRYRRVLN